MSNLAKGTSDITPQSPPAETNGAPWVTAVTLVWLGTVVIFSTYIAIAMAYQARHLNEWGDPTGDLWVGLFGPLYLLLLPVMSLTVVVANVIDLVRNLEMGPVAQVVRMLTIGAAVAAPIITYAVLAP